MDIYFVRHGQTGGNEAKRHQQEDTHLTPLGKTQAAAVAAEVAMLQPTHLYVSNRVRAIETGQAIAASTGLTPETNALFAELCRPRYITGYKHRSYKSIWYLFNWWRGVAGGDTCDEGGESYAAFRERIAAAQAELTALPPEARVVVVSHSVFINLFIAHMCDPRPLSLIRAALCFKNILSIKNGAVAHITHTSQATDTCSWQLQNVT